MDPTQLQCLAEKLNVNPSDTESPPILSVMRIESSGPVFTKLCRFRIKIRLKF